MPWSSFQLAVSSRPTVDFLEGLATNEGTATVSLKLPTRDPHWLIRAITLVAVQNLQWELQLFDSADNMGATIETDRFVGVWQFGALAVGPPASPGWPFTPVDVTPDNGFYHQYIDGMQVPYQDFDQMVAANALAQTPLGTGFANANPRNAAIHCRLINRSASAKLSGADGALKVTFWCSNQGINA